MRLLASLGEPRRSIAQRLTPRKRKARAVKGGAEGWKPTERANGPLTCRWCGPSRSHALGGKAPRAAPQGRPTGLADGRPAQTPLIGMRECGQHGR